MMASWPLISALSCEEKEERLSSACFFLLMCSLISFEIESISSFERVHLRFNVSILFMGFGG